LASAILRRDSSGRANETGDPASPGPPSGWLRLSLGPIVTQSGGGVESSLAISPGWLVAIIRLVTSCFADSAIGARERSTTAAAANPADGTAVISAAGWHVRRARAGPEPSTTIATPTRVDKPIVPRKLIGVSGARENAWGITAYSSQ